MNNDWHCGGQVRPEEMCPSAHAPCPFPRAAALHGDAEAPGSDCSHGLTKSLSPMLGDADIAQTLF